MIRKTETTSSPSTQKKKKKKSPIRNEGGGFFSPQSIVSAKLFAFPNWVCEFVRNGKWVVEDEEKEERKEKAWLC